MSKAPESKVKRGSGATSGLKWRQLFRHALNDYSYNETTLSQFKSELVELGFPQGYIDWLAYMMTRE